MLAQVEIAAMEQKNIKAIEEMRQNMVNAANEAALSVMGLHNELAELEVALCTIFYNPILYK